MRLPVILLLLVLPAAAAAPAALGVAGGAVPDAFTAAPQSVALLPVPKQVQWGDGEFSITPATRIIVGDDAGADDLFAARELNEELRARYRTELDVVREREVADPAGHIVIGEPTSSALLGRLLEEAGGWEVRICESPVGITTEFLDPFDVVVADYSGPAVGQLVLFSKAVSPGTAEF